MKAKRLTQHEPTANLLEGNGCSMPGVNHTDCYGWSKQGSFNQPELIVEKNDNQILKNYIST